MHVLIGLLVAVVLAAGIPAPVAAAPRPVPTETIKTPSGITLPTPEEATDPDATPTEPTATGPLPTVEYDFSKLPAPVQRLRDQLIEAARSGDIEKLRPIIDANPDIKGQSFQDSDDPIEFLKSQSGDPEGREILAILEEVLEAGYVHADVGSPEEMYIWPYFARFPLKDLNAQQMVELFKLITAGDFEDMKGNDAYIFYRVGMKPDGSWAYFEAGD